MLDGHLVKVKNEKGEILHMELAEAHKLYRASTQAGGVSKVSLLTYNPLRKTFSYQTPAVFKTSKDRNTVIGISLDMGSGVVYSVVLSSNCKIYGMTNGFPTNISTLGLPFLRTGKLSIAFVDDKDQSVKFYPICNIFDPVKESLKREEVKGKRGRKKKTEEKTEEKTDDKIVEFHPMILSSHDGSMFICNGVIIL